MVIENEKDSPFDYKTDHLTDYYHYDEDAKKAFIGESYHLVTGYLVGTDYRTVENDTVTGKFIDHIENHAV